MDNSHIEMIFFKILRRNDLAKISNRYRDMWQFILLGTFIL